LQQEPTGRVGQQDREGAVQPAVRRAVRILHSGLSDLDSGIVDELHQEGLAVHEAAPVIR
jgi:hypothetical protein